MIQQVQVVSVPVSDQQRAKTFYLDTLGFELRREGDFASDRRWVEVAPRGASTSLSLVTWFDAMPAGSLQGLVSATDDIHAAYERFSALAVEFERPVQQEHWGTRAVFRDPDGNGYVLVQAPRPPE